MNLIELSKSPGTHETRTITDRESVNTSSHFRPTHDRLLAWNEDGDRLHRSRLGEHYLALRVQPGSWRITPFVTSPEFGKRLRLVCKGDVRLVAYLGEERGVATIIVLLITSRRLYIAFDTRANRDLLRVVQQLRAIFELRRTFPRGIEVFDLFGHCVSSQEHSPVRAR